MQAIACIDLEQIEATIREMVVSAEQTRAVMENRKAEFSPEDLATAENIQSTMEAAISNQKQWLRHCLEYVEKGPAFSTIKTADGQHKPVDRPILLGLTRTLRPVWALRLKEADATTAVVAIETVAELIPVAYYLIPSDTDRQSDLLDKIMADTKYLRD